MSKNLKVVGGVALAIFISYYVLFIASYVKESPIDLGLFCIKGGGYNAEECEGSLKSKQYASTIEYDDTAQLNLSVVVSKKSGHITNVNANVTDSRYYDISRYDAYKQLDEDITVIRDSIAKTGQIVEFKKLNLKQITEKQYDDLTNGLHLPEDELGVRLGEK